MLLRTLSCLLLALVCLPAAQAQKKKGWKLIWQDEFNRAGLPDTGKWGYEVGHIRNMEQQYYTHARPENILVKKGCLVIRGQKEDYPNAAYAPGTEHWMKKDSLARYTSASINTKNTFSFTYGRIEVKAKLPGAGNGIWPAIWMLGTDRSSGGWPYIGEMDIMEYIGNHPQEVYGTIHYAKSDTGKVHTSSGNHIVKADLHNGFHVFALEWDEKMVQIFYDDSLYHSFEIEKATIASGNPFRKPFYILLNLALGAAWPGPIDDKVLPQEFLVDYVRVYQKKER